MQKNSVEGGTSGRPLTAAEQVAQDLDQGMNHRDLSKVITEISTARDSMTASDYAKHLAAVNTAIDTKNVFPRLAIDVLGVDESGKNLLVIDKASNTGLVLDAHGKPVRVLTEEELLDMFKVKEGSGKQSLIDMKTLKSKDNKFSLLMPPGLDTSGTGELKVIDHKAESKSTKDTVTTTVKGKLNDDDWGINFTAYNSIGNTEYTGSVTTTADGKLLESHMQYKHGKYNSTNFRAARASDYPDLQTDSEISFQELGDLKFKPKNIDVKYDPLEDAYHVSIDYQNFKLKDGKLIALEPKNNEGDYARLPGNSYRTRNHEGIPETDADGNTLKGSIFGKSHLSVKRDDNHEIERVDHELFGSWTKVGERTWDYEFEGKHETKLGDLYLDGVNVVLQNESGMEIADMYGRNYHVDNSGFVTEMERPSQHENERYVYDSKGKITKVIATETKLPRTTKDGYKIDDYTSQTTTVERDFAGRPAIFKRLELFPD